MCDPKKIIFSDKVNLTTPTQKAQTTEAVYYFGSQEISSNQPTFIHNLGYSVLGKDGFFGNLKNGEHGLTAKNISGTLKVGKNK